MTGSLAWLAAASLWAAPPDWAVSGKSPSHPPALYLVGSGSSTESVDLARQAAMADVVRQIRAQVRSTSEDEQWETSSTTAGRERGESSRTGAKVKTSEEVNGIQVVETARDGKTWYALAVLDKSDFAAPGRTGMREADADANLRWVAATMVKASKRPLEALEGLRQIEVDRSRFRSARDRAALGEPDALQESFPIPSARSDSLRREVERGFHFRRAKDSVEAETDMMWPDSAGLAVEFLGSPVTGLAVDLADPSGKILGTAKTDSTGFASPRPSHASSVTSSGWSRWTYRPRLDLRPAPEIGLAVRMAGSTVRIRLDWTDSNNSESLASIEDRLNSAGWTIDRGEGMPVDARLQFSSKGEVQGFSGSVYRIEARLILSRESEHVECVGVGTGSSVELASKIAIKRMTIPPESMRELFSKR